MKKVLILLLLIVAIIAFAGCENDSLESQLERAKNKAMLPKKRTSNQRETMIIYWMILMIIKSRRIILIALSKNFLASPRGRLFHMLLRHQ